MSNSILRDKSKKYARDIVCLCRKLKENRVEYSATTLKSKLEL